MAEGKVSYTSSVPGAEVACICYHQSGFPLSEPESLCGHDTQQARAGPQESTTGKAQGGLPFSHEPLFLLLADYSLKDIHACAQAGFRIGAAFKAIYLKLGVSMALCEGVLKEIKGEHQGHMASMLIIFPF